MLLQIDINVWSVYRVFMWREWEREWGGNRVRACKKVQFFVCERTSRTDNDNKQTNEWINDTLTTTTMEEKKEEETTNRMAYALPTKI